MRNYLLPCLLFSFLACHQGADNTTTLAANAGNQGHSSQKKQPEATNIVFQSADGGENWQDISAGLPEDLLVMRILPGKNGEVFLGAEHGVYRYSPPPATETWSNDFPLDDQIVGIFEGQSGLYASWFKSGFFKNLPGKTSWMPIDNPQDNRFVWSAVGTPEGAVVVSKEEGIYKTTDDGANWQQVFKEASPNSLHQENGVLYGVCFGGILRSTDGGNHWDWEMNDDGSYKCIYRLDGKLMAFIRKGDTWTTRFLGASSPDKKWQHLAAGLSGMRNINDFEQAGETLYCSHEGGISRSDDHGKTWQLLMPAPDDNMMLRLAISGGKVFVVKAAGC